MSFYMADTPVPTSEVPPLSSGLNFLGLEEGDKIKVIYWTPEDYVGTALIMLHLPLPSQAARAKVRDFQAYSTPNNFRYNFADLHTPEAIAEIPIDAPLWPAGSYIGVSCTLISSDWIPGPTYFDTCVYLPEPG